MAGIFLATLSFNEDETEQILKTLNIYHFAKELLIYNEIIDPDGYTFPQVLNELRNAYDHFNRALAAKLEVRGKKNEKEYIDSNLDKALGHIYRACYDCLDWLSINVREEIMRDLKPYSHEAIKEVMPEYYNEILPLIPKYEREIAKLRDDKDIAHIDTDSLHRYQEILKDLTDIRQRIKDSISALADYDSKRNRDKIIWYIISAFIGGLITTIIHYFVT